MNHINDKCLTGMDQPKFGAILIIFFLTIGVGCGKKEEAKPEAKPAEVFVVKVEPRDTPTES